MKKYEHMTKKELIKSLKEFSSEQNIKQSAYEDTLNELEAHQIELETQNREMQESRRDLEEANNRYALLYDFAPVGYCTLDKKGIIREINLTGAKMLGIERNLLPGKPFNMFVSEKDTGKFFSHLKECKKHMKKVSTELCLKEKDGQTNWIELLSSHVEDSGKLMFQTIITDITERKQSEEELQESKDRFRAIFEQAAVGVALLNTKTGQFIRINQKYCDFLGYTMEEMLQKSLMDITYHQDIQENVDKNIQFIKGNNKEFSFEKRYVHKDGKIIWGNLTISPLWKSDEKPETYFHVAIVENITERKRAEEALQKSERFARSTVDALSAHIAILDETGSIIFVNRAWRNFAQANSTVVANLCEGANYLSVCDKAYRRFCREAKEFADGIRSVICGAQEEFSLESPCHSPDEKRWFLGRVTRFSGEGPIHVVVAHENITERKEAEDALKINDARLTEAQRVAHIGSWELDVKSHELFWSAETFRIFGYKPDQFSPTMETFFENVHPDDRLLMNEVTHAAFYERKPFDVDHRIILPDGKECYVHERAEVIFDDGGQPVRMTGTVQDITGRRHAEEEQKKLQEQLTQAQKMESVGRLAGGVAHDFNNILGIIIGYAEMIMMDMEPDNPIYPHLQRILNTTQRAADLVRQLLAFARKQTASPEILNINETVANMFRMLKRIIGEDINLIWKPGHDIWNVRIDPVQIDQILANLAVNSRDAISNTGSITLETGNVVFDYAYSAGHAEILPGEFVLLEVSDTGSGMSKEVVEHIFEPFFTTKETGKGTGLGLATVYGIVRQNNGFINVYSEEGKGTSFKIYLPRFKSDIVQSTVEKVSEKPQKGTETLLIAEDEKDYLMSCKIVLEKLGYTVFSAETPEQAITLSKEHPGDIDLLITDVIMPKMNGKELLEKIHKIRPGLKCLYMSGYTANVIAHHGVLDEGVNFLQKPFSVKTIAEKVREVIDSK